MDKRPAEGSVHRLSIDRSAGDGAGVARLDGMVVFVQGGLRGEVCSVRLDKVGKSAIWGHVEAVIAPSPARITPRCPYFGRCGGCQLQHMDYAEELALKRQRVEDALGRIGGADLPVEEILGSARQERYRNKVQFPAAPGPKIGFYRARSHQVVDVEDCLLQPEPAARLRRGVLAWMRRWKVPAYDEKQKRGLVRHVYVRASRQGESLCCLLVNGTKLPQEADLVHTLRQAEPRLTGVVLGVNRSHSNVILGGAYRTLWGEDALLDTLCGYTFRLSVPSFYQVNAPQAEVLYEKALELAGLTGTETVLDLYCGIGTISLVMARRAGQVWGAEVVPQAVADAQENARRNGVGNAHFLCADAGEAARRLEQEGVRPQVVCVDPPRKGLAEDVVDTIVRMGPERVVYVSCDPGTLGRDTARFRERGYQPRRALAVDLFPRTQHVETVVCLGRELERASRHVYLDYEPSPDMKVPHGPTYPEIKAWVLENHGLKVSSLYISQVKRKHGLPVGESYNKPKDEGAKQPQCPPEKAAAIEAALRHFRLIP